MSEQDTDDTACKTGQRLILGSLAPSQPIPGEDSVLLPLVQGLLKTFVKNPRFLT